MVPAGRLRICGVEQQFDKMTQTESLITKARRYCIENHSYWADRYQKEMSGKNSLSSENDYNLFPRYNALAAILQGVLAIVGKEFNSFEECKDELVKIGMESQSIFTVHRNKKTIEQKVIQEEREKFIEFIASQNYESVRNVEPLPFERKFSENESRQIREKLLQFWNYDGGRWEPLEHKSPKPVIFLMNNNIEMSDKLEIEKTIKDYVGSGRIFVISEDRIDYEKEAGLLDIHLYETIICDDTFEWVVYGSHESTTAFGGNFLIDKVNRIFENRKEKINKWEQNQQ